MKLSQVGILFDIELVLARTDSQSFAREDCDRGGIIQLAGAMCHAHILQRFIGQVVLQRVFHQLSRQVVLGTV